MKRRIAISILLFAIVIVAVAALLFVRTQQTPQTSPINVIMSRYNTSRTGTNLQEVSLNTTNVNPTQFGKLFSRTVIGDIYAQPLYVSALNIPGKGTHNVVLVATMHNEVYAFDADDPAQSAPLWEVNLGPTWLTTDLSDIWNAEVGVLSTPVIDLSTQTIYLVDMINDPTTSKPNYWIHALDMTTGQEKFGGPTQISASVSGIGDGHVNGQIPFDASLQFQRPGLVLTDGRVFAAFSGIFNSGPYHGWLLGYSASDLTQPPLVWNDTPNGEAGGIWQSGVAPVVGSDGDLYFGIGNGTHDATDFGISFVHLHPSDSGITVADYFTPFNADYLNGNDLDVGTSGTVMIPNTSLLVGGEKHGQLYVIDAKEMGHFDATDDSEIKESFGAYDGWLNAPPVIWDGPQGTSLYIWSEMDHIKEYRFDGEQIETNPVNKSTFANDGVRSPELSLSADGNKPGTGILWAVSSASDKVGVLRALDASDISHELWNSDMNGDQDQLGGLAKFNPPIVANGKVYLGTFSNQLVVYGLLPTPRPQIPSATPQPAGTGSGLQGQYFSDQTLSTLALTRTDSTIDFDWGQKSPDPKLPNDHFSARWAGQVQPLTTGYYTFSVTADDGVRLWVNQIPLFDHWYYEPDATYNGTTFLQAGQKYDIRLEYNEDSGGASVKLSWQGSGVPEAVIPQSQLYPASDTAAATTASATPSFDTAALETAVSQADASRGSALFAQYSCAGCHSIQNGTGPNMQGVGQRAATRRPGYSAAAYLYESITDPNAYIVPGYTVDIMPTNFKTLISDKDMDDLIAWLLKQ